ncbi:unnamed protein product [Protopolystoma xenopodis]|uniref:Uncharacterized protein n=1 Tax=Protopolystoma xenopodis TaxID=117903 RepID=A0A3S5AQ09_9PLAT|nr:unnamed protein product [Protopolystoma xenopodis]
MQANALKILEAKLGEVDDVEIEEDGDDEDDEDEEDGEAKERGEVAENDSSLEVEEIRLHLCDGSTRE